MSRALVRLTASLCNKPQLITGGALDEYFTYLTDRNKELIDLRVDAVKYREDGDETLYMEDTGVGVIQMDGPLTYLRFEGLCGPAGPSYESIKAQVDYFAEQGAKVIVLDQDTPGGEAYMAFETADYIRSVADQNDMKIIAYVDGLSASAGYVFSAIADEVIVNPQAEVGSIGVVIRLTNLNKAKKNLGIEESYVFAGKSKIPYDSEGDFDEDFIKDLQYKVDNLYEKFLTHVSENRGISKTVIEEMGAKTFISEDAISIGLADKSMTHEEFANYLASIVEENKIMSILNKKDSGKVSLTDLEEKVTTLDQEVVTLQASLEEANAALSQYQEEAAALLKENASLKESLKEAEEAKVKAKADARMASLIEATNEEQAESLYASLESLSDESFEAVVAGFAAQKAALEKSELFEEKGSDNGDTSAPSTPQAKTKSKTLELIEAQYQTK